MRCECCGSDKVDVQVVNEVHYKQGHGLLFTLLFGVVYWSWLLFKWSCKLAVYLSYWIFIGWITMIVCAVKHKHFCEPEFISKLFRVRGKNYNKHASVCVCKHCGHSWEV